MGETRKLAAILVSDVVGYSRLAGADEDRILARLRALRSDLIDPTIAVHHGRIVKRTGDGSIIEFRSVVDAVRCAIEVQSGDGRAQRRGRARGSRIEFRIGIHLGDVVEESDGDLMGDGVNIAARLEGIAEPGAICLSEDAYRQVKGRLDLPVADLGQKQLKNIVDPIRVYAVQVEVPARAASAASPLTPRLALPDKPSIAVLPFQNMSDNSSQDYFVDGMVEDIVTGLSHIKWLFVIARNSSFVYKGKAVDVRQIGRELGVRYVLEGSVRRAGSRLRITAQLVEAESGAHLWADKYDGAFEDVFDLQDRITDSVVGVVEPSVKSARKSNARGESAPESLDAYDLFLRALPFTASQSAEEGRIAIGYLEQALRIDPDYAAAHGLTAWCYEWCFSRAGFNEADKGAALSHAKAAMAGGTDDATALAIAGFVTSMLSSDHAAGLSTLERALSLNPSCATGLYLAAAASSFSGRAGPAMDYAKRALRLSPFDLLVSVGLTAQGIASVQEHRYDDAAIYHELSVQANPTLSSFRFFAACAHALAGKLEAARDLARHGLEMEPGFRTPLLL